MPTLQKSDSPQREKEIIGFAYFFVLMIKVVPFIYEDLDDLYANTYLVCDKDNNCVVIDPAKDYQGLVSYINKNSLCLKAILLTHGHADHIRGVDVLYNAFHAPVYIGFDDADKMKDSYANCSMMLGQKVLVNAPVETLSDNKTLSLLDEDIKVIHVPFHTAGSVCFYLKESGVLFTGDFILPHGIGRSDLPSAKPQMLHSSMAKILALPKNTKIYPGHGPFTSIEQELKVNPFVK